MANYASENIYVDELNPPWIRLNSASIRVETLKVQIAWMVNTENQRAKSGKLSGAIYAAETELTKGCEEAMKLYTW